MRLTSNTGLLAAIEEKPAFPRQKSVPDLRCDVTLAPFMLRPYAGIYNPFSNSCSVLCKHPAHLASKELIRQAKDSYGLHKSQLSEDGDKEKIRTPHDIVTEDMFRRYAETDSRPLTPAPTLASAKSRGSRRCLTPDHPFAKTAIVLDLRRSHSQADDLGNKPPVQTGNDPLIKEKGLNIMVKPIGCDPLLEQNIGHNSPLTQRDPPLTQRGSKHTLKSQIEQTEQNLLLSSLNTQADLGNIPPEKTGNNPWLEQIGLKELLEQIECNPSLTTIGRNPSKDHVHNPSLSSSTSQETLYYHGHTTSDLTAHNTSPTNDRSTLPSLNLSEGAHGRLLKGQCQLPPLASPLVLAKRQVKEPVTVRTARKTQLKSLNLGKPVKGKSKTPPTSERSKTEKDGSNEALDDVTIDEGEGDGECKRRGKRRKKGRNGSDRMTSAGLAAQAQQDPETQIAGIATDSQNPSSRGSVAPSVDDDIILPIIKPIPTKKMMDSFLDDDILKYLHREVDEAAIETEFDIKRRYVYEEAFRTKPERPYGTEMQLLLKEMKTPSMSLGDWLHIPRVFSRQNAQFSLPLDSNALETLSPMNYAARFVTLKRSKQLLYLTVLRKFRDNGYRMPIQNIEEGLMLMMGGILTPEKAAQFRKIMEFDSYYEDSCIPDEIKLTMLGWKRSMDEAGDADEIDRTLKFRTWCGLCAICERMFGRFPPRRQDPPDGIELSDFSMVENRLAVLKVHKGLVEVLNIIRER